MEDKVKCTCTNLVGGTEYKIKFITRKKNFDDEIFENITNQYTGLTFNLVLDNLDLFSIK